MRPSAVLVLRAFPMMLLAAAMAGCGCSPTNALVTTDPQGAVILVNGTRAGVTPTQYPFDFCNNPSFDVTATLAGYFDAKQKVTTNDIQSGVLKVPLTADPAYNVTVASDAITDDTGVGGVIVQGGAATTKEETWSKIVADATQRYHDLKTVDAGSNYLVSEPFTQQFPNANKAYDETVQVHLVVSVVPQPAPPAGSPPQPMVYKLELRPKVSYGNAPGDVTKYPRVFKEDAALIEKIKGDIRSSQPQ
jgi:hypothetical protein